jgi:hypothetical protein
MRKTGQIRVGKCVYDKSGKRTDPSFTGFTPIVVLTKSSAYGDLSPYMLKDPQDRIVENVWQASKVYEEVPEVACKASRYEDRIIWSHGREVHAVWDAESNFYRVTKQYLAWRRKLMNCQDAVRYPVGYGDRHKCVFAMGEKPDGSIDTTPLTYIEARKRIYVPVYVEAVRRCPTFAKLKARVEAGENLLIIEVDGPHEEDLAHYIQEYDVPNNFIVRGTLLGTSENLSMMLNDPKHPYGHGYCLAAALLDMEVK